MIKSDNINELAAALAKAQAKIKAAQMNAVNPFLKNKYADLGATWDACRSALTDNGLSVVQLPFTLENRIGLETVLMHSSGQFISTDMSMEAGDEKGKSDAQVAGSIISYLRRYMLAAMVGVYSDEDTDGNKAEKSSNNGHKPEPKAEAKPAPKMSLEMAQTEETSEGVKYGDLDSNELSNRLIGLAKAVKDPKYTPEQHEKYQRKIDAITVILDARSVTN